MSMLEPRTLKTLGILVVAYIVLALPAYIGPAFLAERSFYLVLAPYVSLHVFTRVGIPGLLENDGFCGWGWCSPTLSGWIFLALFWIALAWLAAWAIAKIITALTPNS
jgi:hypothetical protein